MNPYGSEQILKTFLGLPILESSQVGEARRCAIALGQDIGFSETETGRVGIVASELANNLLRHAQDGLLLLRTLPEMNGLELLALDQGPGISDIYQCLQDGYSSAATLGQGLGAVQRLSTVFDIYSQPGLGTVLVSQFRPESLSVERGSLEWGAICQPKPGEVVSGDLWAGHQLEGRTSFLLSDGLGHGPQAAQASLAAEKAWQDHINGSPAQILEAAHTYLRPTRGAAMAVITIDLVQRQVQFAGIGNLVGSILTPDGTINMVSYNGTVGHEVRKIQEFTYPWAASSVMILHSDGLGSQWRLDRYPGLINRHPSLVAGVLYRDYHRTRDDVTVLVVREVM